jgi:hypothetical protein
MPSLRVSALEHPFVGHSSRDFYTLGTPLALPPSVWGATHARTDHSDNRQVAPWPYGHYLLLVYDVK